MYLTPPLIQPSEPFLKTSLKYITESPDGWGCVNCRPRLLIDIWYIRGTHRKYTVQGIENINEVSEPFAVS